MNNIFVDLHTHSTCSDGTDTPFEVVKKASEIGLKAIALTDHDCTTGIAQAMEAGKFFNIEVIAGIEFAAYYENNLEVHILGLFVDHMNKALIEKTKEITAERTKRNIKMVEKLCSMGFSMTYEDIQNEAKGDICSRTHYANVMVKKGYVKAKNEAFKNYIGNGKEGFIQRTLPTPEECIKTIHQSGGVAILAHPTLYNLNYNQITTVSKALKEIGLDGIETLYSTYKPEQKREILKIAKKLDLLNSGGSDYHGENKKDIALGIGLGNLKVPYTFVEEMKNRRQ